MSRRILTWVTPLVAAGVALSVPSLAGNPNTIKPPDYASTPVARYATMDASECYAELDRRAIPYAKAQNLDGVDAPVRIVGPLHGVIFTHLNHSRDESLNADTGVADCRLVLALDDFSRRLVSHGVVEVAFISAYRPRAPGTVLPGQRHPAALAMDVAWMRKSDGSTLNIQRDFHGRVGARTCGSRPEPPRESSGSAVELRSILCEAADQRLFNLVLTPNYNREHYNHVHLEVRRNIDWILVQ